MTVSHSSAAKTFAIPVNDLTRLGQVVLPALTECAHRVLARGHYVLGSEVAAFEQEFAAYCGAADCVGVANGTDAIELALRAVGAGEGSGIVVAANAAMYGTTAVLALNATPVFADVDPLNGLMTADTLRHAVASHGSAIDVVVVTHLYGRMADMRPLMSYARDMGIRVIEDCAQAHGARGEDGQVAGTFGDAASFSFYPTKNLGAMGDGGAVVSQDPTIAARLRQLRQYGWSSKYTNQLRGGRNSRLDEIQAAFLRHLLPMLDTRNSRRRAIANRYSTEIRHPAIRLPLHSGADSVAHLYVVQSEHRDALSAHLRALGIGSDIHYPIPDHRQPVHEGRYASVSLPVTEALCRQVLTLPCFPEMRDVEVDTVIAACNDWRAGPVEAGR